MLGIGDTAISVGTDDTDLIARLEPWRIDLAADLVDYGVRLQPLASEQRGAPRKLPHLRHGSTDLAYSRDTEYLTGALLRILGSFTQPAPAGHVRLGLMPIERNGVALLAPTPSVGTLPERWMKAHDMQPHLAVSSLIHLESMSVVIDPPLGSSEVPRSLPLAGWWFASYDPDRECTPGQAVALAMGIAEGKTEHNPRELLANLARFVEQMPPGLSPLAQADILAALEAVLP